MKRYSIIKVDTSLYIKGFSGTMVYLALYLILGAFGVFTFTYLLIGPAISVGITVILLLFGFRQLSKLQKKYGQRGLVAMKETKRLPQFINVMRPVLCDSLGICQFKSKK